MRVELLYRIRDEGKRNIINSLKRCETALEKHRDELWKELENKGIQSDFLE
ncbi:hypothetical protein D042_1301 [Vibrio parahaemolyticus NIHCB0757]|nr:hypothetical protein D042_1301 [Vibrio parahaemolyticus NIHCB0757]